MNRLAKSTLALLLLLAGSACTRQPEDPDIWFRRGKNAMAEGRYDWARIYFARDFQIHPERLESCKNEGLSWISGYQRGLGNGIECFREFLARGGRDEGVQTKLVRALILIGRTEEARTVAESLSDHAEGDLLLAETCAESDSARAIAALERFLAAHPEHGHAHAVACQAFRRAGARERALNHGTKAVALDPFQTQTYYRLSFLARELGDPSAADRWLELHSLSRQIESAELAPNQEPATEVAQWLERMGQLLERPSAQLQLRLCRTLLDAGQPDRALACLDVIGGVGDLDVETLLSLAALTQKRSLRARTKMLVERAFELDPDRPSVLSSMAQLAFESGDFGNALDYLKRAIDQSPDLARLYFLRASIAAAQGRPRDFQNDLERAVHLAPWQDEWRIRLAETLLGRGEDLAARDLIAAAGEQTPALQNFSKKQGWSRQ